MNRLWGKKIGSSYWTVQLDHPQTETYFKIFTFCLILVEFSILRNHTTAAVSHSRVYFLGGVTILSSIVNTIVFSVEVLTDPKMILNC